MRRLFINDPHCIKLHLPRRHYISHSPIFFHPPLTPSFLGAKFTNPNKMFVSPPPFFVFYDNNFCKVK